MLMQFIIFYYIFYIKMSVNQIKMYNQPSEQNMGFNEEWQDSVISQPEIMQFRHGSVTEAPLDNSGIKIND